VLRVHGDKWDGVLRRVADIWVPMANELRAHFGKEERIFFPMMLRGDVEARAFIAQGPMRVMLADHEEVGKMLDNLTKATNDFVPLPEGCGTVRALGSSLQRMVLDTRRHLHVENYVLFPRFIAP
jgi:regulator of cell morphogenesis and NO signaling